MDKSWSQRITELEALDWSLTEIGREIGLSSTSVSDIKNGRTKAPTGMSAVRLYELSEKQLPAPGRRRPLAASGPGQSSASEAR